MQTPGRITGYDGGTAQCPPRRATSQSLNFSGASSACFPRFAQLLTLEGSGAGLGAA